MPKKTKPEETGAEASGLVKAAKKVGSAAGKIAALVGVETPVDSAAKTPKAEGVKAGRLEKKTDKHRLPRRQKKALESAKSKKVA